MTLSRKSRIRALTVLASSCVALLGGWLAWRALAEPRETLLKINVLPRENEPPAAVRPPEARGFEIKSDPIDPREWRYFMNERQAGRFFTIKAGSEQVYDPWVYCRDAGNLVIEMPWAEHPDGKFTWKSNSLGCREDHEVATPAPAWRVLVAGDSHTCGVCNDAESWPNLLEARLAREKPPGGVEVLNAALGGYSFYNYLGTLLRMRSFAPQVFVVGVFGGNDFQELLPLYLRFQGLAWQPLTQEQEQRRNAALAASNDVMGQGFASIDAFRNWPESQALALHGALQLCGEIDATARARGAKLLIVYIPSPFELSLPAHDARVAAVREALALADGDLARLAQLSDGFLAGLRELAIEAVDLRPVFAAEPSPPYWKGDFHLNLRGHQLAAQALPDDARKRPSSSGR